KADRAYGHGWGRVLQSRDRIHHAERRIAPQARRCRNRNRKRDLDRVAQALIAAEVEEFVLYDGPARGAAELLQLYGGLLAKGGCAKRAGSVAERQDVEIVAGVPGVGATERVSRAVQSVGTGLDTYVDYGESLPAIL